ncbi:oligosaccharide repeat unit polymerase [Xenorhabdus bovienii]|uniref:O-antigen polymerase n=1 Tax=Xenorhabdus bovienii TaxID=40576 RepID=UPI0023B2A6B6|nr:O-antigen polymerase [Xenorhabdus bovienii]MDE9517147.1 oligosaccharide repeat unit polymerase [Xenorhabdus bovienii]
MLELLFLTLFISMPIIIFYLLKIAGEKINKISIINITTMTLYLFSIVGTLPLFYLWDDYRVATGVKDQELILKTLFYSSINILFFIFGVIFISKIIRLRPIPFLSSEIISLTKIQKSMLFFLYLLCFYVLILYINNVKHIALFISLTDGVKDAIIARSNMGNNFNGKYHWYKLILHDVGNLLTFTTYILWLNKKNLVNLLLFMMTFTYSTFVAIMATEKAPFLWLTIGLFMTYYLTKKNGIVPFRKLLYLCMVIISILSIFYIFFMGSSDLWSALSSIFSRAFSGSISPAYFYLEYFPEHRDFLLGQTFPNPQGILPYTPINYTIELMNWKFPEQVKLGVIGTLPTVFWGEAYANFGPVGVPVVAFIIGSYLSIISYLLSKIKPNPIIVSFYVWLILHLKNLSASGFSEYIYSIYIFSMSVIILIILLGNRRMKVIIRN